MKKNMQCTKATHKKRLFVRYRKLLALLLCMAVLSGILPDSFTSCAAETIASLTGEAPDFTMAWKENGAWGGSIAAEILLKNNGSHSMENWQIDFDWTPHIDSLWGASYREEPLENGKGSHYTITPYDYNCVIAPGQELSIGFIASGEEGALIEAESYVLSIGEKSYRYDTKDDSIRETEPEATNEPTATPEVSVEPELTASPEATPEITEEPTPEPTTTPEVTTEPEITEEPTPEPTASPEATPEPEITEEPTPEPTVTPEVTPEPEITEEPTPEPTVTPEVTIEPEITEEPTPKPTTTPEVTIEPEITEEPTPEPTVTPEVTEEPTPEPTKTPEPEETPEPVLQPEDWDYTDDLVITRDTALTKNTSCRNLLVQGGKLRTENYTLKVRGKILQEGGEIIVCSGPLEVKGDYCLKGEGFLSLEDGDSHALVRGDYLHEGTGSNWLQAGTLEIQGNVSIQNSKWSRCSIIPTVKLSGSMKQTVKTEGTVFLYDLDISESKGVDFLTDIRSHTFKGTENIVSEEVCFRVEKFEPEKDTVIPCDVTCAEGIWNTQGHHVKIEGDLTQECEEIIVGGGLLEVEGDYRLKGESFLSLADGDSHALIRGDYLHEGTGSNWLQAGTLEIQGDVSIQTSKWVRFSTMPVIRLSGTDIQTVDADGAYLSRLDTTESAGVDFLTDIYSKTFKGAENIVSEEACFRVENFEPEKDTVISCDVTCAEGIWNTQGHHVKIEGDLTQESGEIIVGGGLLEVEGDYRLKGESFLSLADGDSHAMVRGDYLHEGTGSNWLQAGTLEIQGDVSIQTSKWGRCSIVPTVKLSGFTKQYVDAGGCQLYNLDISESAGVEFTHDLYASTLYGMENIKGDAALYVGRCTPSEDGTIKGDVEIGSGMVDPDGQAFTIKGNLALHGGSIELKDPESSITVTKKCTADAGKLILKSGTFHACGDMYLKGDSGIVMETGDTLLDVDGTLKVSNRSNSFHQGSIRIGGNLTQTEKAEPGSLFMWETVLYMDGEKTQNISLQDAKYGKISLLDLTGAKKVVATGTIRAEEIKGWDKLGGEYLEIAGLTRVNENITYLGAMHLLASNVSLGGRLMRVGKLEQYDSTILLEGGELKVEGDYGIYGKSLLNMNEGAVPGRVCVKGNFETISEMSHLDCMGLGSFELYGHLTQAGYSYSFTPRYEMKVRFMQRAPEAGGNVQKVCLSDSIATDLTEDRIERPYGAYVEFENRDDIQVSPGTLIYNFREGMVDELCRLQDHPVTYIAEETLWELGGKLGMLIGAKLQFEKGAAVIKELAKDAGAGALEAAGFGLMVSMILSTSMWMNIGKPNEAAYSAGRSIMNALLGEIIIKLEGAAVKLAAQAGEAAIAAGKKMQEYAGKALKDFDFGDFLDSVKNRLSWKQQMTDPDNLFGMDFKEAVKNAGTDTLENIGSHLSADAKELLNRQIEDGLVTHNGLKDLENLLEWGPLNNLDSNQLRAALVCDPDSMSHKEFQSIMEWTEEYSASLNNVSGDGITCLSNRWDDLGSIGAQDETMKQLEQESARLAAGGEQMDAAGVKKVVKKAKRVVESNTGIAKVYYKGKTCSVYRGGDSFIVKSNEVKINPLTGNVKTSHGVSVDVNSETVSKFGGAYKIEFIPEGLELIQRGIRPEHFEIVPVYEMSLEDFQGLLNQIVVSGPY